MTFSVVGRVDTPHGSSYGVAVASKFLAVGSVVPEARLGSDGDRSVVVGAAATQASAKWSYKVDAVRMTARKRVCGCRHSPRIGCAA